MSSTGSTHCPKCGANLASPGAECANCLLALGFATVLSDEAEAASETISAARVFAGYELLDEIARGGMGIVYRARQRSLGRTVAVKLIVGGQLATREFVHRFRAEAAAAAALQHPNIVAIHEVGIHEGNHFFSMDYVEGRNLAQLVGNRPLSAEKAARYLKTIAEAIHFAHEQGILHRDLKPSNVLVDAATDQPRITDFGLAKRLDGESSITLTGQVLGSPNFMPPEQASGKRGKVGRHSDVYGLGGILYYTLTARAPFQGATLETTIHEVLNSEPLSPRVLSPSVPRDLETICLKCLEKEASRRYQTAQELAEELGRFLNDEPIHARPVSRTQCAWRWCRRKPALAGSLAAVAVLLLLVAIGAPIAAFRISHERNTAERNLYVAEMNLAAQAWEAGNIPRARELLGQHWPGTAGLLSRVAQSSTDVPSFEWRLLWGLAHEDHSKFSFSTGTNRISCVAVSPNGEYLGWGSADGVVRIIDLVRQHEVTTLSGHADGVSSLAFSADGRSLASGGGDGTIRLWESGSWREVRGFTGHSNAVRYVAFHPNGTKLISSGDDALRVWELGAGEGVEVIRRPDEGNTISADGTLLASYGGLNNRVRFWKLGRKEPLPSLPPQKGVILATAFFPDGKSALISAHDSSVTRWDLASMKPTQTYRQKSMVGKLALSANGQILATASYDNVIKLWDVASGQELRTLRGHTNAVATLVLSADGRTLVSASEGNIKIWDSSAEREMNALHHQGLLLNMSLSRNGKLLATSDPNFHTVSVWDVPSQRLRYSFTDPEHKGRATVALSPNSRWLAVQWFNRKLELWDLSEEPFQKGPTHAIEFALGIHLNFSPDGRVLSFRGTNGMVKLWNVAEQKIFGALANHGDGCATAFSMDSKIIATSSDREIRLWDVQSQRPLGVFNAPRASVWSLSFSPDGRLLAAGSHGDNAVRVWDVADPTNSRLLTPLVGHTAGARAVAFSPDGRTLASGSLDSTVKLWSVALWQEVATLREHSSEVGCLAFSSDGNMLFTGSGDATVRIWRAPTFQEIENKETKRGRQP